MCLHKAEDVIKLFETLNDESNYFRGYTDYDFHMKPSLGRGDYNEFEILHTYYSVNNETIEFSSLIDVIEHAQHYGEKTRLLDWSLSPWVALYFANYKNSKNDETSYIGMLNTEMPSFELIPTLSNTWEMIGDFTWDELGEFTWEEISEIGVSSTKKYLSNLKFNGLYEEFLKNLSEDKYLINRYSTEEINHRKKLQKGLFTFHKDPKIPMERKHFDLYVLELPKEEKVKLLDILSKKYGVNGITLGFDVN